RVQVEHHVLDAVAQQVVEHVVHDGPVDDRHHGLGRLVGERAQARAGAGRQDKGLDHSVYRQPSWSLGALMSLRWAAYLSRIALSSACSFSARSFLWSSAALSCAALPGLIWSTS